MCYLWWESNIHIIDAIISRRTAAVISWRTNTILACTSCMLCASLLGDAICTAGHGRGWGAAAAAATMLAIAPVSEMYPPPTRCRGGHVLAMGCIAGWKNSTTVANVTFVEQTMLAGPVVSAAFHDFLAYAGAEEHIFVWVRAVRP